MIDIPDNILPVNAQGQSVCPKCQKLEDQCTCPVCDPIQPKQWPFAPIVRLDKKGRKGKAVTMIEGLPAEEAYLKALAKRLKSQTGSGGTFYIQGPMGIVEIQGDHVEKVASLEFNEMKKGD